MTPPIFFRQLRKTTALFMVVFLVFFVQRIVAFFSGTAEIQKTEEMVDRLEGGESVVCHNIVGGSAFGIDSIFMEYTRIYFYSRVSEHDSIEYLKHTWYCGLDTMLVIPCTLNGDVCISSIAPERLRPGDWSVDLVRGRKILASKQFWVESAEL